MTTERMSDEEFARRSSLDYQANLIADAYRTGDNEKINNALYEVAAIRHPLTPLLRAASAETKAA